MSKKTSIKYNATEVRITRCVVGLFLYFALALSIWGVRRLYRAADFLVYITAVLFIAAAVTTGILMRRQKKAGIDLARTVWGMDYWFYIALSGAAAHTVLALTRPVEFWTYTAPIVYVMLALHYLLYVTAVDQGKNFCCFGFFSAAAGLGVMAMYQTYYNSKQLTISTRIFSHENAFTVGWVVLAAAAVFLLYIAKKKKTSFWKQLGVVGIFALYWLALQMGWGSGLVDSIVAASVLGLWYVLLRVLKQIKVIA